MNSLEFVNKLKEIAKNYKTLYVMGCFGAPLTGANVERYCNNHSYNKGADRTAMIKARANQEPPYFGFDCVCLIKGVLWGWNGNAEKTYGGASYACNGVPDIGADQMINVCNDVSTDFSKIQVGEAVWMEGHIGVYIGDGLAVECTPKWNNCVQITACNTSKPPYHRRDWKKHGKLPYVEYSVETVETPETETPAPALAVGDVVNFTGNRHYISANSGTGKKCNPGMAKITAIYRLGESQHPYHLVKEKDGGSTVYGWVDAEDIETLEPEKEPEQGQEQSEPDVEGMAMNAALIVLADAVIAGKFGNGAERKENIYNAIQEKVNELMGA